MDRAEIHVEVAYCPAPGQIDLVALSLPEGATLADALQASALLPRHGLVAETLRAGIWGKAREPGTVLRERDRVEIYRPLTVDPKEARRQRYQRHRDRLAAGRAVASPESQTRAGPDDAMADDEGVGR